MSLFKRGSIWWAYFTVDGVRHQHSTGTTNRRIAEQILHDLKEAENLKRYQVTEFDPEITFQEVADQFTKSNPAPFNLDRLKHLIPFFGPMRVSSITRNRTSDYRAERKRRTPSLKDATLNKDLGVLRHILYWAVEAELIPANPLVRIPMVPVRRTPLPVLTVAEEERLLAAAKPHLRVLIIAALDTGMRRGELLGERWEHVDLIRKVISVSRSKTPEGEGREIPLTRRLADVLSALPRDGPFVFAYLGAQIHTIKTSWRTAQRKAGLTRRFRFHDLRHCFNTRLMEAGVIADVRKALMGHTDRSVHSGYTHVELRVKRSAIQKLEEWIELEKLRIVEPST
jgi:integrase